MNADPAHADPFHFAGQYRVQGCARSSHSHLAGRWTTQGLLSNAQVNAALQRRDLWRGCMSSSLIVAHVSERSGQFESRADILYKRSHFQPDPDTLEMPLNIVDALKSERLWAERRPYAEALIGDSTYAEMLESLGDLRVLIGTEYFVHEGGHCLGYDVDAKIADRYFHPDGQPAALLIALEELRADLHAFGLATELLGDRAGDVLVYNVLLRLGAHLEGLAQGKGSPYGLIPFLLFGVLRSVGVEFSGRQLRFADSHEARVGWMRACDQHASDEISRPEMEAGDPIAAALRGAQFVRRYIEDEALIQEFGEMMTHAHSLLSSLGGSAGVT